MKNPEPILKREKLSTYFTRFDTVKKELLNLKWHIETNVEYKDIHRLNLRMEKVAKILFEIEKDFEIDKKSNKKYKYK